MKRRSIESYKPGVAGGAGLSNWLSVWTTTGNFLDTYQRLARVMIT